MPHKDQLEQLVAERTDHLRKLSTAVEQSASAILITDQHGTIEYVNPRFCTMSGYTTDEVVGQTPRMFKSGEQDDDDYADLWSTIKSGQQWRGEFRNRRRDGSLSWDLTSISPIRDPSGDITHFVAVKEDISERRELQDQLRSLAHFDTLTKLPNRALFFDRLAQLLSQSKRQNRAFAVLFVDLDGFKNINDTLGHHAGDQLLESVGDTLRSVLRASDTAARMGGDEFTLLIAEIDHPDDATIVAKRILTALSKPIGTTAGICQIGASIGVACFPTHATHQAGLVALADAAMYEAKRSGKNTYRVAKAPETPTAL